MSLILTLGHAYAVAIGDIKKVANFVETKALPVLQAAKADAPTVEAITPSCARSSPTSSAWATPSSVWSSSRRGRGAL